MSPLRIVLGLVGVLVVLIASMLSLVHSPAWGSKDEVVTFVVQMGNKNQWPWDSTGIANYYLTDTLPTGMTFITATAPWDPNQSYTPIAQPGGNPTWIFTAHMHAGEWWRYAIVAQISDTVRDGDWLTNMITIVSTSTADIDPLPDNKHDEVGTLIRSPVFEVNKVYTSSRVAG